MEQLKYYQGFIDNNTPEDSLYVGWSSREKQEKCFDAVTRNIPTSLNNGITVLDIGCGAGDMGKYLPGYTGIDINPAYITQAKFRYPRNTFRWSDIRKYHTKADYVLACGTFNLKCDNNIAYITEMVEKMYSLANKGVAFNLLSRHSLKKIEGLYYYDPGQIFNICKHRYNRVSLNHSYCDDDFTIYIYKE